MDSIHQNRLTLCKQNIKQNKGWKTLKAAQPILHIWEGKRENCANIRQAVINCSSSSTWNMKCEILTLTCFVLSYVLSCLIWMQLLQQSTFPSVSMCAVSEECDLAAHSARFTWQQSSPPAFDHLPPVFHYQHYQCLQCSLANTEALQSCICYKQGAYTTKQPTLPQTPATLSSRPHCIHCPPAACCRETYNHQAVVQVTCLTCVMIKTLTPFNTFPNPKSH